MRRKVCYTFRRVVFRTNIRRYALKEGFNVKSGKSLKVVCERAVSHFVPRGSSAEEGLVFRSF